MNRGWSLLIVTLFCRQISASCNSEIGKITPALEFVNIISSYGSFSLHGTRESIELFPGYTVEKVFDATRKKTYFIDPNIARIEVTNGIDSPEKQKKSKVIEQQNLLNKEKIRKHVCANYKSIMYGPQNRPLAKMVRKHLMKKSSRVADFLINLTAKCAGISGATFALALGSGAVADIVRDVKRNNLFSEHESNFSVGLMEMATLHQCLSVLGPTYQREFLRVALTAGALSNVYFDLDLGMGWQWDPIDKRYITTDVADLTSGALGILSYAALGRIFERHLNFSLLGYCK